MNDEYDSLSNASIGLANYATIGAGRTQRSGPVQSRMLLWCRGGGGTVRVNGQAHELAPGSFGLLPWDSEIVYIANQGHALELGGIHLLPSCAADDPTPFRICHALGAEHERLARTRSDVALSGMEGALWGQFSEAPELIGLVDYIVAWYQRGDPTRTAATHLALTLLTELVRVATLPAAGDALPGSLRRVLTYVRSHLAEPMDVPRMSAIGHCSPATLARLFRKHLMTTPIHWLRQCRMDEAARLLTSTDLPVGAIARRVGIDDACHFARLFRAEKEMPATAYRRTHSLFSS